MIHIRSPRDFASGAFLALLAAFVLWSTWDLPLGRGVRLGPGFVPFVLAIAIGLFGLAFMVTSLVRPGPGGWQISLRGLICVFGAIAVFGLTLERFGLAIAAPALLLVASLAFGRPRLVETTVFVVALTAAAIALFGYALGLTVKMWP